MRSLRYRVPGSESVPSRWPLTRPARLTEPRLPSGESTRPPLFLVRNRWEVCFERCRLVEDLFIMARFIFPPLFRPRFPALFLLLILFSAATSRGELIVTKVRKGFTGSEAGLLEGDRISGIRIGNKKLPATAFEWWWTIEEYAPRSKIVLDITRKGKKLQLCLDRDEWGVLIRPLLGAGFDAPMKSLLDSLSSEAADRIGAGLVFHKLLSSHDTGTAIWLLFRLSTPMSEDEEGRKTLKELQAALENDTSRRADPRLTPAVRYIRAVILNETGQSDEAIEAFREFADASVSDVELRVLPCRTLAVMGETLQKNNLAPEALKSFMKARRALEESAPDSILLAAVLHFEGSISLELGKLEVARSAIEKQARLTKRRAPESLAWARSLNIQANLTMKTGDPARSEELFIEALELQERMDEEKSIISSTLQNLGVVAAMQRKLDRAENYFNKAIAIRESIDPDSPDMAFVLGNAAIVAQYRGDFLGSEKLLHRALRIYEEKESRELEIVPILINLGKLSAERGNHDSAESYYRRGLKITEVRAPDSDMRAVLIGNLGWLEKRRGNIPEAIRLMRQAMKIIESSGGSPMQYAELRENLGRLLLSTGKISEAGPVLKSSLKSSQNIAPISLNHARCLDAFALYTQALGDQKGALEYFREATEIIGNSAPGTWSHAEILHDLANLLHTMGRKEEAVTEAYAALTAIEQQVDRLGATEAVRADFRSKYLPYYRELEQWLLELGNSNSAFEVFERSRSRSFAALLAQRDLILQSESDAELDTRRKKLGDHYDAVLREAGSTDSEKQLEILNELRKTLEQMENLREEIRRSSPLLARMRYPESLKAREAAAQLKPGCPALAYSVGSKETILYIVRPGAPILSRKIHYSRKEIEDRVSIFRGLVGTAPENPEAKNLVRNVGASLYKILIAPAGEVLAQADHLIIVPDGPLQTLSFAALVGEDGKYLIEDHAMSSVLSLSVLSEIRRIPHSEKSIQSLVAFGNPWLSDAARDHPQSVLRSTKLEVLPGAREEVLRIAGLNPEQSRYFLGREATEKKFYKEAPSASALHLATHILIDTRLPLNSAIVLASDPEDGQPNGLLQAWEIIEKLRLNADVVSLSGCESGLGSDLDGEGLIGLTRAFELAGAHAIVHTLWSVEDRAQAELMLRTYQGMSEKLALDTALRRAQLAFIRQPLSLPAHPESGFEKLLAFFHLLPKKQVRLDHPFYWAAVTIEGDGSAARTGKGVSVATNVSEIPAAQRAGS